MKVKNIVKELGLSVFCGDESLDREVTGGYVSDLLSDVMGNASEGDVWVTLQTHKNVMAVASLKEVAAVILVKGHKPDEDTLAQGIEEEIPLLGTEMETFELTGKLYELIQNQNGG
ncbi:DRTGG domain-containing protein [Marinilabilia rubra]|uniref:Serine kinase n=1 Tax=Marinilabilia rubra TaxID=2162893 RepID=A0A2U2BCS5_9BACT|nr:DRTGG domain-containing protein [Marinilabilia rubra]PWE00868.1 serine kinase [Marinilabilia rubra]